jgi:hydrogenase maturation factor
MAESGRSSRCRRARRRLALRQGECQALAALRSVPGCEEAAEIGEVKTEPPGMVLVETAFGGKRVMDQLVGDPLPRIC